MIGPRKLVGIFAVLALVAAACGSGGESSSDPTSAPTGSENDTPTTAASAAQGENTAVVTIGANRYEFDATPGGVNRCDRNFNGAIWVIGVSADGSGGGIALLLPPPNDPNLFKQPPTIRVDDKANDLEWRADPEFWTQYDETAGLVSQVDSWTTRSVIITGSATFVESNSAYAFIGGTGEQPEPIQGTFEISCAG